VRPIRKGRAGWLRRARVSFANWRRAPPVFSRAVSAASRFRFCNRRSKTSAARELRIVRLSLARIRSIRPRTRSLFPPFSERSWGDSSLHSRRAAASRSLLQLAREKNQPARAHCSIRSSTNRARFGRTSRKDRHRFSESLRRRPQFVRTSRCPLENRQTCFFLPKRQFRASQSCTQVPVAAFHWFRSGS